MVFQLTSLPLTFEFLMDYLMNGACYGKILHERHIIGSSHIHVYGLSVDLMIFELYYL